MDIQNVSNKTVGDTQKSSASKYDLMIDVIRGEIQGVNIKIQIVEEDGSLTPDEKKDRIKKLEDEREDYQIKLARTKATKTADTMLKKVKDVDSNQEGNSLTTVIVNKDGDTLELSKESLLRSDNNANTLQSIRKVNKHFQSADEYNPFGVIPVNAVGTSDEQSTQNMIRDGNELLDDNEYSNSSII